MSTPWHTDTVLGTQLADKRRPAICQPTGFGRQAKPRLGLSWDGTSLHTGVGELVFHPEEGGPVAQFLQQQCVTRTPERTTVPER